MELLAVGAESEIYRVDDVVLKKVRLAKPYRLEIIDNKLRKFRNKREFKVLNKLFENKVNVPKTFELFDEDEISFTFEFIDGNILKKVVDEKLLKKAFEQIVKMHNCDIVHNDLTTLNMIEKSNKVYLIDFGLAVFSNKIEDKAVDLNLFFTCIKNEHPDFYSMKSKFEKEYSKKVLRGNKIIDRLHKIEQRGRNK